MTEWQLVMFVTWCESCKFTCDRIDLHGPTRAFEAYNGCLDVQLQCCLELPLCLVCALGWLASESFPAFAAAATTQG